jgi:hypothetical protein
VRGANAASGRRDRVDNDDADVIEHIVGWPTRSERTAPLDS